MVLTCTVYEATVDESDVNLRITGENSDEYESVGSACSDSSDCSGDDIIERREFPEAVEESDEEVVHMDDAFIQSMGGKLTLENIDRNALQTSRGVPFHRNSSLARTSTLSCCQMRLHLRVSYKI